MLYEMDPIFKNYWMVSFSYKEKMTEQETDTLEIPTDEPRRLAIGWLLLAVGSLVMGGILTVLIVLSRTPGVQSIIPWTDFFHTAIVVHVDLTVMVWFIAFAGVLWSLNSAARNIAWGWLALMELGGIISVAGGVLFFFIAIKALWPVRSPPANLAIK